MGEPIEYDAVIVGSGPNGLAAGITLARAGRSVLVLEGRSQIGGGMRTAELTLPGFRHDVCSTIFGLARSSPFFAGLPVDDIGIEWVYPDEALAHPLDDGSAMLVQSSVEETARQFSQDARQYRRMFGDLVAHWKDLTEDILSPIRIPPKHPVLFTLFGLRAMWPARMFARAMFRTPRARALFAGMAGHSIMSLDLPFTAAYGFVLNASAHATGWPVARGGAQTVADGLANYLRALGGRIETGHFVRSLAELPKSNAVFLDVTPRQFVSIAGEAMPKWYRRRLQKYRYGPGVFKVDYALDQPIPWRAAECRQAATVHLGGTLEEIGESESLVWRGRHPEKPYLLLAQQSLFDSARAPQGKHTAWVYCHVPNGSKFDMLARIEAQIERFAPGFRDTVLARCVTTPAEYEAYNPNYIGGDINGGVQDMWQNFTRPVPQLRPYFTPIRGVFLCSSSTPPGGGVHGMSGYSAARAALGSVLRD